LANRMFARAAHGIEVAGKEPSVEMPQDTPLTLPVTYPDYQSLADRCLSIQDRTPSDITVVGHFIGKYSGGQVSLYAIEGRFLADWFPVNPKDARDICFSDDARARVFLDSRVPPYVARVTVAGGPTRQIRFPGQWGGSYEPKDVIVQRDGTI